MRCIALPYTVNGVTLPNCDGSFTVYINSVHSSDKQRATLEHELSHIRRDHFYSGVEVRENELEASADRAEEMPDSFVIFSRSRRPVPVEIKRQLYRVLNSTIDSVIEKL